MKDRFISAMFVALLLAAACGKQAPEAETVAVRPYGDDESAARAAALQKACELAVVYLGTDDPRAAAVVENARAEALEAVRRAPDTYRGAVFARTYERLDAAATALAGAGVYSPPLSDAEYERLRGELIAAAEELKPFGEDYYLKVTRQYEGVGRRRPLWGPMPAEGKKQRREAPTPSGPPTATPLPPEETPPPPAETPPTEAPPAGE
jgi:hypothetical protein